MRILWPTINRRARVAEIFGPLQREVLRFEGVDIKFVRRSDWSRDTILGADGNPALLDPDEVNEYDILFTDAPFAYMNEAWDKIKIPKALLMEDQHGALVERYVGDAFNKWGFDTFFVRYRDATRRQWPQLFERRVCWLPHSFDSDMFFNRHFERKAGLLCVGRDTPKVYPVRADIHAACKDKRFCARIVRPEEGVGPKWPTGADYARLLCRARIASSCTSIYGYPILKTLEIPASGTVLFSDFVPEMADMGFEPEVNFLPVPQRGDIVSYVRKWLKRGSALPDIAQKGCALAHKRHTSKARAKEFMEHLLDIPALQNKADRVSRIKSKQHKKPQYNHWLTAEDNALKRLLRERYALARKVVHGTVIDAACAYGVGTAMLASVAEVEQIYGFDMDADAVAVAQQKLKSQYIKIEQGNLEEITLPKADWLVTLETIEHLEDPFVFLAKAKERVNGILLSVPIVRTNNPHHAWTHFLPDQVDSWFEGWTRILDERLQEVVGGESVDRYKVAAYVKA